MLIDPRHLEQIAVIVDTGTLREAAEQLGTSQPALSRTVHALETRLETTLFERASRPLRPTVLCLALAEQGRAIRTARIRAAEMVGVGARGFFGTLKIGAPPFLCGRLMSTAIAEFLSERENVRIDLSPNYKAQLLDRLNHNKVDMIVGPSKFVEAGNSDFRVEPLFEDTNVVVGRAGHPLLQEDEFAAIGLENTTWIGHHEHSALRTDMENALKQFGVMRPRIAFQSESAGTVLDILRASDFLTILPRHAIRKDGTDGLATARLRLSDHVQIVSIITLAQTAETKLTLDFKEHLRRTLRRIV